MADLCKDNPKVNHDETMRLLILNLVFQLQNIWT